MSPDAGQAELAERVRKYRWYHTIELAPGVVTPGYFDTREAARLVPMPASLEGRRCLDVGTYDGFWAFEMERRGASEVVAIDVLEPRRWDWPVTSSEEAIAEIGDHKRESQGFEVAREALGSSAERLDMSVYDLDRESVGGFEFVYLGSLLLHLRDPVRALERVREVCDGEALIVDAIDVGLTLRMRRRPAATLDGIGRPWWWKPNSAGLARMVEAAGFEVLQGPVRFYMPFGAGTEARRPPLRKLVSAPGREAALLAWRGDPHAAVLARPA